MILRLRSLVALGAATFLAFLVAFLPAGLALRLMDLPVGYSAAEGTVWHMTLRDARIGGLYLGTLDVRPRAAALAAGDLTADIAAESPARRGSARFEAGAGGFVLGNLAAIGDIDAVFGTLALRGALSVSADRLVFDRAGRCLEGAADLRSDILARAFPGGDDSPVLAGTLQCREDGLRLFFKGGNALFAIEGQGTADGSLLDAGFVVRPRDAAAITPDLQIALNFAGLRAEQDGWHGRLKLDLY